MKLETNRLLLRSIDLNDAPDFFSYRSDTEANKYQSFVPVVLKEAEQLILRLPTDFNKIGTWFQLGICKKGEDNLIGDIGVHFIDNEQVEIGITLSKDEQRKGFAKEALTVLFDFLFKELNKHRITASVDPANVDSLKLMEKLGMRKEAHHIQSLFFKGEWVDDIIFALLKKEWK
ncbi:GNAT family N-acetyltransferase [Flammeovirga kamogawensis]|uniref:GNAT family N-acetyltransferase n=1 Tax=Flammeovirga kamogawensis TaxID=373891 RepID=A0ABX8H0C5_9BACT|nr:GNAT family protein [Flammeovirga kamogawensis]MBB6459508.1 RimJ/RimL family protein N-acetyltransferase [Flammeovirga kamogawensis]QWG09059.1 GNAT family N-acetyltransferase [Flammeovirga kamogawensis]TRX67348.1 GNAT family N-acetyltransferase [Flammeovirga kamogawensis]